MMSTPPPLLLYLLLFSCCPFFSLVKRPGKKSTHNYDTTTTTTKNPYNWDQAIDWFMNFFLKKKCSYKDKTIHPLSLLYLALYIKLQVPTIYLQTSSVTLFSLFASAWLYIKWYGHKTCYIYIYISTVMDKSVICFILLLLLSMLYIIIIFLFFLPKSYCFFVAIKQHPHLLQTYND